LSGERTRRVKPSGTTADGRRENPGVGIASRRHFDGNSIRSGAACCGLPIVQRALGGGAARFGASARATDDHRLRVFLGAGTSGRPAW